jgi:hypothetical protein
VDLADVFLASAQKRFGMLKRLGEKAMSQVPDGDLHWTPDTESNSIGVIVQHLNGNMLSRWTAFLTVDGEKTWRDRDGEFEHDPMLSRRHLLGLWEEGWQRLFTALGELQPEDLMREVNIRGQALTVLDAIHRQLTHYGYHVGQIVYLAKVATAEDWQPLSIPRGMSREYKPPATDPVD